jgi:hypothetical protein
MGTAAEQRIAKRGREPRRAETGDAVAQEEPPRRVGEFGLGQFVEE